MEISFSLDTKEIDRAIKEIEAYRDSFAAKCERFINELAELGILVAEEFRGEFEDEIAFNFVVDNTSKYGADGRMYGLSQLVWRAWMTKDGITGYYIDPLLMVEFGSGPKASDASGKPNADIAKALGMGRASHPLQKHANQPEWSWLGLDGEWHTSSGIEPTMPMFKAALLMKADILKVAKEVFQT